MSDTTVPTTVPTYYKILVRAPSGELVSCHGGTHTWAPGVTYGPLPVVPCRSGFHACRIGDLAVWQAAHMLVFEVALEGELKAEDDKVVAATATLGRCLGKMPVAGFAVVARRAADRAKAYAEWAKTGEGPAPSPEEERRLQGEDILAQLVPE